MLALLSNDANMSVPRSGAISRSGGLISAIAKQLRFVNLKPVKNITFAFDPFHEKTTDTRKFLFQISSPQPLATNPNCLIKTNILCDRSDPTVTFSLANGDSIIFKSNNLTTLELLKLFNKHITPLAPVEEPTTTIKTKSERKAAPGRRVGKTR